MRYLFIHQNFPAQYLHITRRLVREGGHQVVFLSCANESRINGVTRADYRFDAAPNENTHPDTRDLEVALRRAEAVARACGELKGRGFSPDIIIGHHGWGELLNVQDVYPGLPVLGFLEFYYRTEGLDVGFDPEFPVGGMARVRARNAVNHLALTGPGWSQTPTEFQLATYPAWSRRRIMLIQEGVDLDICKPDPGADGRPLTVGGVTVAPGEKLVTFLSRSLEPYRGFHTFMRALPGLTSRKDVRVVIVGGDGVSYGPRLADMTWKERFTREMAGRYDASRVHFVGRVDYADHVKLLQRTDAHVYLTYPFVASWSLREALACGSPVIASDTAPVTEFVEDRVNGILTPFFEPGVLAETVLGLFEDDWLDRHVRRGARLYAQRHLSMSGYLDSYREIIDTMISISPNADRVLRSGDAEAA